MADGAAPQHSSGITHAGSNSATGQPGVTPSSGASDEQTSPVAVWAALAVVVGLVGFVVLSVVASTVVIFFFSTSQAPCVDPLGDGTSTTGADNSVPLPAADPSARLQVSIVSWNTYYKNSTANILRGFRAIEAAGGASVGLQEQNNRAKLRDLQRRLAPEWTFVGTQTRHPIAYRTGDYQLLASGVVKEHGPHKIESGPGGRSVGNKYVVWVELRDKRTRATFIHINDHKIAAVERSGHPRKDNPTRVRLWHQEDQAVGEVIAKLKPLGVPIFKTADENLAAKADAKVRDKGFAYVQMQKRGMYSNWRVLGYPKKGTHGTRAIDYVWATTNLAAPVRQRILGKYGSDHSILVVDLDNQKAASTARTAQASLTTKTAARPAAKAPAGSTTNVSEEAVWRALRDNFAARAAAGRLSPDGAQMMFDSQHVGVAIPLNVRGRGTMTGMDDRPREVQFLYTPDPRRARTSEDVALLDALRPSTTRWPRKMIELPPAAEVAEALDGKKTSVEWEQLLRSSLVPFDPTAAGDDTDIPLAPAAGGDGDTAPRRSTVRADRRADRRDDGDVDERDVDDKGGEDEVYEGYDEPTLVRVETVEVGDLIRLHERGPWVCVELVDQIGPAYGGQVQLDWRDDDDNAGEQLISTGELAEVRRPLD